MNYQDTDETLATALARDPNCLGNARRDAVAAWNLGRSVWSMMTVADKAWKLLADWDKKAQAPVAKLRIALLARAALSALGALNSTQLRALAQHPEFGVHDPHAGLVQCRTAARAAMETQPALAALGAEMNRIAAEHEAVTARVAAMNNAECERKRPAVLLAKLRADGVGLQLEGKRLTVPAQARLSDADRAAVVELKASLVALLKAEADAAVEASRRVEVVL